MSEFKNVTKKTREYLDYLDEHYDNVKKAWKLVQTKCKDMIFMRDDYMFNEINSAIEWHDMSKLYEPEFSEYRIVFYPTKKEKSKGVGLDKSWEHHKLANGHHWERWTTNNYSFSDGWIIDCVHMVCDWMAMGMKSGDTAKSYYETNKSKIKLTEESIILITEIFIRLY